MSMPTIMVVDDCQSIRLTVKRILSRAGYSVIIARDGEEAIAKLSEYPSLIVLDVNMPGLDGYGFCERMVRENPVHVDTPVVFLTSERSRALELLGSQLGAYLQKPVSDQELLSVVEEQLTALS
jgi:CheY-like chemotaxis protein